MRRMDKRSTSTAIRPVHGARQPKLLDQLREKVRLKHYSIRTGQVSTTMIYTYVLNRGGKGVVSPLDQL